MLKKSIEYPRKNQARRFIAIQIGNMILFLSFEFFGSNENPVKISLKIDNCFVHKTVLSCWFPELKIRNNFIRAN